MIQLVIDQAFILWHVADQGIGTERDPHAVTGQIVGCNLLFQLQFDLREEMSAAADFVGPFSGIIACFQEQEGLILKKLQGNWRDAGV